MPDKPWMPRELDFPAGRLIQADGVAARLTREPPRADDVLRFIVEATDSERTLSKSFQISGAHVIRDIQTVVMDYARKSLMELYEDLEYAKDPATYDQRRAERLQTEAFIRWAKRAEEEDA